MAARFLGIDLLDDAVAELEVLSGLGGPAFLNEGRAVHDVIVVHIGRAPKRGRLPLCGPDRGLRHQVVTSIMRANPPRRVAGSIRPSALHRS